MVRVLKNYDLKDIVLVLILLLLFLSDLNKIRIVFFLQTELESDQLYLDKMILGDKFGKSNHDSDFFHT